MFNGTYCVPVLLKQSDLEDTFRGRIYRSDGNATNSDEEIGDGQLMFLNDGIEREKVKRMAALLKKIYMYKYRFPVFIYIFFLQYLSEEAIGI